MVMGNNDIYMFLQLLGRLNFPFKGTLDFLGQINFLDDKIIKQPAKVNIEKKSKFYPFFFQYALILKSIKIFTEFEISILPPFKRY